MKSPHNSSRSLFQIVQSAQALWIVCATLLGVTVAQAGPRSWDGDGVSTNNNWNNPANWDGDITFPANGDDLFFVSSVGLTNVNGIVDLRIHSINFTFFGGYLMSGNALTITNGIMDQVGSNTNNIIMTLGASQTFSNA